MDEFLTRVSRSVTYGTIGMVIGGGLAALAHYVLTLFFGATGEFLIPLILIGAIPGGASCAFLGLSAD